MSRGRRRGFGLSKGARGGALRWSEEGVGWRREEGGAGGEAGGASKGRWSRMGKEVEDKGFSLARGRLLGF
jgi:hypothetical protein